MEILITLALNFCPLPVPVAVLRNMFYIALLISIMLALYFISYY